MGKEKQIMIIDRIVQHLRDSGFNAFKAGNDEDIERKPCVVVGMANCTQPWLPLPAKEYTLSVILFNNRSDSEMEEKLVEALGRMDCGERCDFFNLIDSSSALDGDDWVTTWTVRYIER